MIGKSLGQYEITDLLGKGGMGEVYRAHDSKLDRDVAIKLLPSHLTGDAERLARFQREAKMLASLNHPKVESPTPEGPAAAVSAERATPPVASYRWRRCPGVWNESRISKGL